MITWIVGVLVALAVFLAWCLCRAAANADAAIEAHFHHEDDITP